MVEKLYEIKKNISKPFTFVDRDTVPPEWVQYADAETAGKEWSALMELLDGIPREKVFVSDGDKTCFTKAVQSAVDAHFGETIYNNTDMRFVADICADYVIEALSGRIIFDIESNPRFDLMKLTCPQKLVNYYADMYYNGFWEYVEYVWYRLLRKKLDLEQCVIEMGDLPNGNFTARFTDEALEIIEEAYRM